jgi:hypothetical protein
MKIGIRFINDLPMLAHHGNRMAKHLHHFHFLCCVHGEFALLYSTGQVYRRLKQASALGRKRRLLVPMLHYRSRVNTTCLFHQHPARPSLQLARQKMSDPNATTAAMYAPQPVPVDTSVPPTIPGQTGDGAEPADAAPEEPENASETLYIQNLNEKVRIDGTPAFSSMHTDADNDDRLRSAKGVAPRTIQVVRRGA